VWRGGDAINLSIGQGDLLATPLQVATSVAAVANGGSLWRPHVAAAARRDGGEVDRTAATRLGRTDVDRATLRVLRRGLRGVTGPGGTAAEAFDGVALPVAGKTGTAESATQPFAWFAGYAPAGDPRYVVVTMLEEGGSGSRAAAPIARWIVDGLAALDERSG
jgi:penicillin-binding protein 2